MKGIAEKFIRRAFSFRCRHGQLAAIDSLLNYAVIMSEVLSRPRHPMKRNEQLIND